MLCREVIAVYSENCTNPINTLCGQNAELHFCGTSRSSKTYFVHYCVILHLKIFNQTYNSHVCAVKDVYLKEKCDLM
jgi:hypothetical protein